MSKALLNFIIIFVSAFLFLSAVYIYVSNRSGDMALYSWLGIDYNNYFFELIRNHSCRLSPWAKYNLPDGLWMLSFLLFMESVWGNEKRLKWMFCAPIIIFAVMIELLQYKGFFPGTGDVLDIVYYIATVLLFLLLINLKQKWLVSQKARVRVTLKFNHDRTQLSVKTDVQRLINGVWVDGYSDVLGRQTRDDIQGVLQ